MSLYLVCARCTVTLAVTVVVIVGAWHPSTCSTPGRLEPLSLWRTYVSASGPSVLCWWDFARSESGDRSWEPLGDGSCPANSLWHPMIAGCAWTP